MNIKVFVGGVFDLFHIGHLRLLQRAKDLGQMLIVGVLTDEAVAKYKPKPVIPFEQRKEIVEGLSCVDFVVPLNDSDATKTLSELRPNILVHGDDHTDEWEIGQSWIADNGGEFVVLERTPGVSSKMIKDKICGRK